MRLAARGGIIRGGGADAQGKFCLCSKFLLLSPRDDFQPAPDPACPRRLGGPRRAPPGPRGTAHAGGEAAARSWRAASGGGFFVPILPLPACIVRSLAAG